MSDESKPVPPGTPPPPTGPHGPTHPTPSHPRIYALAESLGFGDLETPARRDPMESRSGLPSVVATPGGPVMPNTRVPLAFGVGRVRPPQPGQPDPMPSPNPTPPPAPPPRVGEGPLYDALPDCPGKVLNDGIAVVCGRGVTHYPHELGRAPGAL